MERTDLLTCVPAKHLYIAIPTYTGQVSMTLALSLMEGVFHALTKEGITVSTGNISGNPYIDHARNLLANIFLTKTDCTDMLFIDSDIAFDPQNLIKIAKATVPLVAGIYPKKTPTDSWPVKFKHKPDLSQDLVECLGLPTGFMRINRGVFTEMLRLRDLAGYPDQFLETYVDMAEGPLVAFFRQTIIQHSWWGEDYNFCRHWMAMGGRCMAIPNLYFEHVGAETWKGNLAEWLAANPDHPDYPHMGEAND